jgi:hypothetical protein
MGNKHNFDWHPPSSGDNSKPRCPPHVILETLHGINGEDGRLLIGELTAIVGTMTTYIQSKTYSNVVAPVRNVPCAMDCV